ncbi:MAG: methyltransferase domain-containing protein [Nitrospirae bacterium]|nr:MAG: methyltransferase domain-containing protein [Nitrospirota bacterium]
MNPVRDQYEAYPYPPRNPEDERSRLENSWHDFLEVINFYCFRGAHTFSQEFRVLVAGGGTGDQTIFLAEQLRPNRRAEVVHLDISANGIAIARRRAEARKLANITWVQGSILDLPALPLGRFDYINCVGVLHHLEDPPAGLRALNAVLKEDGAMSLMLYGKYGRTGVYQLQDLLRRINRDEPDLAAKIANAKAVLAGLPKTNWFKRGEDLTGDHREFGDAGIVDLLLHTQDRAFTVEELYDLVEGCGLQVVELLERGRCNYKVEWYIKDLRILDKVGALPWRQQQALAELIAGDMIVHNFYVARKAGTVAVLDDLRNVPFYFLDPPRNVPELIERSGGQRVRIEAPLYAGPVEFTPGRHAGAIFQYLDGERCLKEIFEEVKREHGLGEQQLSNDELLAEFRPVYEQFNDLGWMLLRHRSVGRFRSIEDLQRPV